MKPTVALITTTASVATALAHGAVTERRAHPRGAIAIIPAGEIAVYTVRTTRLRSYLFRTLERDEPLTARIPGLSAPVRLLLQVAGDRRHRILGALVAELLRLGHCPTALPDLLFLRLGGVVAGRSPDIGVVRSLLKVTADEASVATRS